MTIISKFSIDDAVCYLSTNIRSAKVAEIRTLTNSQGKEQITNVKYILDDDGSIERDENKLFATSGELINSLSAQNETGSVKSESKDSKPKS